MSVEHTLAIILPEGMSNAKEIIDCLKKECFIILNQRHVHLTPEQVSDLYQHLYGRRDFPLMVAYKSSAPVIALCLGRKHAVDKLLEVVGPPDVVEAQEFPKCFNAQFGNYECNLPAVHASRDRPAALEEIHFFFPNSFVEPVPNLNAGLSLLDREVRPLLEKGLAQLLKDKPLEPMLWLADWLLENNPNQPRVAAHLRRKQFTQILPGSDGK